MTSPAELAERYGAPSPRRRLVAIIATVVLAVVFGVWLAWAALFHGNPSVRSGIVGFDVVDDHTMEVSVEVDLDDVEEADCLLRALSEDKATVGELSFAPVDGVQTVTVRTERRATSVENVGCRTEGQSRRR
ncbi:DUF4307 domain-containing protein [Nocardioides houyundeii]|uniref:DUF4307 domain-containing protein n=1 Tax=Nocardioides houyundeii TaxID=2045452 RepID=UPI001315A5F8|nr:DUF4307 domain-containing protein [Nocardioides houyundeii]